MNPELGGTTLNYAQMVQQSSLYLSYSYGLDPRLAIPLSNALPGVCLAYNCVYDVATNTGEHSGLRDISVMPQSVGYTVVAVPIAVPAAIESWTLIKIIIAAILVLATWFIRQVFEDFWLEFHHMTCLTYA